MLPRVEHALASVSAEGASGDGERDDQQRQRHKYRGGDQQDDERHDEHSDRVVNPRWRVNPSLLAWASPSTVTSTSAVQDRLRRISNPWPPEGGARATHTLASSTGFVHRTNPARSARYGYCHTRPRSGRPPNTALLPLEISTIRPSNSGARGRTFESCRARFVLNGVDSVPNRCSTQVWRFQLPIRCARSNNREKGSSC